ncbi:protein STICHEL-like 4 [Salvia splendens]|uniref:protein STICHEL-like 4 n=1 Tax=Salvia splendens TaxID=180675 RepID=UPI001C254C70|nr:protein STICHEL-like 4 [Salvia splendens]
MAGNGDGDRIHRYVIGNISDHLQNHIHLTNCIHLKNHVHKQSPSAADATHLRDLVALHRLRRLRGPSEDTRSASLIDDAILHIRERRFENGGECSMKREESNRNWRNDKSVNMKDMPLQAEEKGEEPARSTNSHGKVVKKEKRRRFRSGRRNRPSLAARDAKTRAETSNTFLQGNEDDVDQNCSSIHSNKCGIPLNWSSIHHRGKSFLEVTGRSLSRGLSESRSNKEGAISDKPITSENSSQSNKSGGEALPLLLDASESQKSIDSVPWIDDDSGELSLAEMRSSVPGQHQNFTQKYMPRTFSDVVGQSLVVQALSNAVMTKKIGLMYAFYGPHGTGKTACARIFARALNCQFVESSKPCGFCDPCIADEKGKSRNIRHIGPVDNINSQGLLELFQNLLACQHRSQYGVFIIDECDAMDSDCWSVVLKVIRGAPSRVVIILVCSSLDALPHVIVSRCEKFSFPKLKEAEMVRALQLIARKEDVHIDRDALKLIASRSCGSLRDAEMTLEQLSLLGGEISLGLVQKLIGLISDEKLVDLLDFALSADTINTVKNLRDIMSSGVEPLALLSQLATIITDILAGSYHMAKQWPKRKFFHQQALSKADMEKLRHALKTLSESEKQLRVSSERMTWLTAALLQLAPDQRYTALSSSSVFSSYRSWDGVDSSPKGNADGIEEIWLKVLENIKIKSLKEFMHKEGKMASVSFGAAPTVQLVFNSQLTKSVVEKFSSRIIQAFEAVLGSAVTIEIRQWSREGTGAGVIVLQGQEVSVSDDFQSESERNNQSVSADDEPELSERKQRLGIVRRRVTLGHVIKHADAREAASRAADKLEQENIRRLEARSRRLLCWKPPKIRHHKVLWLKIRRRKPQSFRKFVSCGRCLSARSQISIGY